MDTRKITGEYRLAYWAKVIGERKESGLSITAYCESAGFHPNIYYYWQRKLQDAANRKLSMSPETEISRIPEQAEVTGAHQNSCAPNGWAVCRLTDAGSKGQSVTVEIGKCKIIATTETNQELFAEVCRTLVSLC